jgi:hypothetical protein
MKKSLLHGKRGSENAPKIKICEHCKKPYPRKKFPSGIEDFCIYKNRRYCSRLCADEARKKRARDHYTEHRSIILEKKKMVMKRLRDRNPEKYKEIARKSRLKKTQGFI